MQSAVLGLALCTALAGAQKPAMLSTVVMLSDIHFDPFHDPQKFARLSAAPATEWQQILREPDSATQAADFAALQAACKARGADTPMALLVASLAAEKAQAPSPLFVTVSGDLMAHQFDCRFQTLAPGADGAAYSAFAAKTVAFVALELKRTFAGVPVYLALGNNDSGCGDYDEDQNSAFLRADGEAFAADVLPTQSARLQKEFSAAGDYAVSLPKPMQHTRLLVLQDIFESKKYKTCSGNDSNAGAKAQIAWLRAQLVAARTAHESVWVMAHIPPGVDAYSTFSKGRDVCATEEGKHDKAELFLGSDELAETIGDFADLIKLALFGHTHMDEMRFYAGAASGVPGKLVPSISPVNGNTPAFTVAQIAAKTATLVDYTVFTAGGADARWNEEYRYSTAYGQPDFSAASAKTLTSAFLADRTGATPASQAYERFYFAGLPMEGMQGAVRAAALQAVWPAYACSITQTSQAGFRRCVCDRAAAVQPQP